MPRVSLKNLSRLLAAWILVCLTVSLSAQPAWKEFSYQRATVGDYIFEGVVISKDGREPILGDPYWRESFHEHHARNKSKTKKWSDKVPFEYVFRIKRLRESGETQLLREIRLDELPGHSKDSSVSNFGPLWFAGFSKDSDLMCFWRYEGFNGKTQEDVFYELYYWDLKQGKFLAGSEQIETYLEHGSKLTYAYQQPRSYLSPSGKYLAILVWGEEFNPDIPIQNHVEIIKLMGKKISLKDRQTHEMLAQTNGKQARIREVRWNAGDQLECVFTQSDLVKPSQSKSSKDGSHPASTISQAERSELKTFVYADTLFAK